MDFHGIDLNLLVAFNALMNERNVTRAAIQTGVSQPAMSAALSRLRILLGDPLFQRSNAGLIPTSRAGPGISHRCCPAADRAGYDYPAWL